MTRTEAEARVVELEEAIGALENQLLEADAASASLSSGGGSKSFTNRSTSEIKAKIAYAKKERKTLLYRLGKAPDPNAPVHRYPVRIV